MNDDPFEPGLSAEEMGRRYRRWNGEFSIIDSLDRELSIHHSRFHGPILTVHHGSGSVYAGDFVLSIATELLRGSGYHVESD